MLGASKFLGCFHWELCVTWAGGGAALPSAIQLEGDGKQ